MEENSFFCPPALVSEQFLVEQLLDTKLRISDRFRALFSLRNLKGQGPREALISATRDSSNLLAHEAAFALGQMQDVDAVPALKHILENLTTYHPIVRHEAAEALGAIGKDCVDILRRALEEDPAQEVRETCQLALKKLEQGLEANAAQESRFFTVDPAMPAPTSTSVADLRPCLMRKKKCMNAMLLYFHYEIVEEKKLSEPLSVP